MALGARVGGEDGVVVLISAEGTQLGNLGLHSKTGMHPNVGFPSY